MTKAELLKVIRAKCLDCCANMVSEIPPCPISGCPLHPLRMGKDPTKTILNEERRKELAARLKKARSAKR